jgi:hypothetical protein
MKTPAQMRSAMLILLLPLAYGPAARAQSPACPLSGQTPMLVIQLFFGQSIPGGGQVTPKQWRSFLEQTVTPLFPAGFTVYDAYGQWRARDTHTASREHTKVVMIAAADGAQSRSGIATVSDAYRKLFHQQSVGILTSEGCGSF